jgi:hypothetical protein
MCSLKENSGCIINLELNKGHKNTLGIRNEVRFTIEAFTFLSEMRKGITKMEA